ncbi:MAG: L-threonylcarbamoyladenylate synthase [Candidatus Margulisbacteria bacterium]|nr:L-threonylcarbamoyladenylate synthase [Candidatus Margulisiibacteriota bacterium]
MLTPKELEVISKTLSKGGIIGLPTDTVYGLACDAYNLDAIKKITDFKERDDSKHYVLQIAKLEQLKDIVAPLSEYQMNILNKFWPGEITFIFQKSATVSLPYLHDTVGVRIPNHASTQAILSYYKNPLVVTSLNKSGKVAATCYKEIDNNLLKKLDYLVVEHNKGSQVASTIVDLTKSKPTIIRQGKVVFA